MAFLRASVPTLTTLRSMTSVPAQASMILVGAHLSVRSIETVNIPLIFNHGISLTISRLQRINNLHYRFFSSISIRHTGGSRRYRDFGSGYNTSYDPYVDTRRGPLHQNKAPGRPPMYPRDLKRIVDDYVVGQERAKKTICSAIFNHYQNVRRRNELELQERSARERQQRQQLARERETRDVRHPDSVSANNDTDRAFDSVQGKYADDFTPLLDHQPPTPILHEHHSAGKSTVSLESALNQPLVSADETPLASHVNIDKSNLLLIGPTGVGKTYILETLSKKLKVPFAISDCNSFTQAGYIGQDVEACIERLLIEANYDIQAAENGIVVLDEFDKIARRESNNGRDVGGEGVQQALLKLVEGTKVTVNVKDNRSSRTVAPIPTNYGAPPQPPSPPQGGPSTGKSEQYTIDTRNILFVFCGAFVGLDKVILRRVSRPALGFGADVKPKLALNGTGSGALPPELFAHLPHHPQSEGIIDASDFQFSPLDLATPTDLQAFGFIPELIGRLHNICALSNLSVKDLYRVLTEPRNCLVSQYTALFETYPSHLGFTNKALHAIAERAAKSETGARGLKMEMERVLAEPMFLAPQSYVLITEACVNGTTKAECWGKDGRLEFGARIREEDGLSNSFNETSSFDEPKAAGQCGA